MNSFERKSNISAVKRILSFGIFLFGLLLIQTANAKAQSYTQNEQTCYDMVQGKVAWNQQGNKSWGEGNLRNLCRGTTLPERTVECFRVKIANGRSWEQGIQECRPETMIGNPKPPVTATAVPTLNLNGNWAGYLPDNTKSTYLWAISQSGAALSFLDVGGSNTRFSGTIQGNRITDSNGKIGTVSADGRSIRWSDNVTWVKQSQASTNPTVVPTSPTPRPSPVSVNPSSTASPLSTSEMNSVMSWIAAKLSADRLPFCYRQTFTRGVGETLTGNCRAGLEKSGLLCYPKCRNGYVGEGVTCSANCPTGFTPFGFAFCQKPAHYLRGAGYPWKIGDTLFSLDEARARCARDNPQGCEKNGEIIYPKCRSGFHAATANICTPDCPAGWSDTVSGCTRPNYNRGVGETLACRPGLEQSGLICYESCGKGGYAGVGPVCWQNCPSQTPFNCGAGCATSQKECGMAISDMVISPIMAAVSIASLGTASGATTAANGAKNVAVTASKSAQIIAKMKNIYNTVKPAIKAAEAANNAYTVATTIKDQVDLVSAEFADNFADMTTPEINSKIDSSFTPATARAIKIQWAKRHFILMGATDLTATLKNVLTLASVVDPTGLIAVENAFYHPVCSNDTPFPTITRR